MNAVCLPGAGNAKKQTGNHTDNEKSVFERFGRVSRLRGKFMKSRILDARWVDFLSFRWMSEDSDFLIFFRWAKWGGDGSAKFHANETFGGKV